MADRTNKRRVGRKCAREVIMEIDHGKDFGCPTERERKPAKVFRRRVTKLVLMSKGPF